MSNWYRPREVSPIVGTAVVGIAFFIIIVLLFLAAGGQ